jgi:GNAT superfamily N-acetyltransferase
MEITYQQLTPSYSSEVLSLQSTAYPSNLHETWDVLEAKLLSYPHGCYAALTAETHTLIGYLFSHPWNLTAPVPLNHSLSELPPNPNCYYIHDLVVHPSYRGKGIAQTLIDIAFSQMKKVGVETIALVAVGGASRFWGKILFVFEFVNLCGEMSLIFFFFILNFKFHILNLNFKF